MAGAVVLGASGDTVGSHGAFARRLGLPSLLLADVDEALEVVRSLVGSSAAAWRTPAGGVGSPATGAAA